MSGKKGKRVKRGFAAMVHEREKTNRRAIGSVKSSLMLTMIRLVPVGGIAGVYVMFVR